MSISPPQKLLGYALISAFLLAIGIYIHIAVVVLSFYHPLVDVSQVHTLYQSHIAPEIEIPLYATGCLFVVFFGLFTFGVLKTFFNTIPLTERLDRAAFLVRFLFLQTLAILFLYLLGWPYTTAFLLYAVFIILGFGAFWKSSLPVLGYLSQVWTVLLGVGTIVIGLFAAAYGLMEPRTITDVLRYLWLPDTHIFFTGYQPLVLVGVLVATVVGLLIIVYEKRNQLFDRFEGLALLFDLIVFVAIAATLFILVPSSLYPGFENFPVFQEYKVFMGPINDILGGKTLLVNVQSQYGVLAAYTLTLPFLFLPFTFTNFFWINIVSYWLGYALVYRFGLQFFKSRLMGVVVTAIIIAENYLALGIHPVYMGMHGFLRYGWWIVLSNLIYKNHQADYSSQFWKAIEAIAICYAFYWGFDSGLQVVVGYGAYGVVRTWLRVQSLREGLLGVARFVLQLVTIILIGGALLTLFTVFRSGVYPDWIRFYWLIGQFIGGLDNVKLPLLGPHVIVFTLAFVGVIYVLLFLFLKDLRSSRKTQGIPIVAYLLVFGMIQIPYYLGRSVGGQGYSVFSVWIILLFYFLQMLVRAQLRFIRDPESSPIQKIFYAGLGTCILVGLSYWNLIAFGNAYEAFLRRGPVPDFDEIAKRSEVQMAISEINADLAGKPRGQRAIGLISSSDTYLLVYTQSVNLMDSNNIEYFILTSQLTALVDQLKLKKPRYMYVDAPIWTAREGYMWSLLEKDYRLAGTFGMISKWERIQ